MMRGLMRDREKLYDDSALRYRVDDINAFLRKEYTQYESTSLITR